MTFPLTVIYEDYIKMHLIQDQNLQYNDVSFLTCTFSPLFDLVYSVFKLFQSEWKI